ncbi:MAG: hypothetical protein II007_07840 [Gammaproteobacteria bacterium]|nr:hypothetical protein [Gammaproteobacteria bacterium]
MNPMMMPLMITMMSPAENRNQVLQAVMPAVLPLSMSNRTLFTAMSVNDQVNRSRAELQSAEAAVAEEVLDAVEAQQTRGESLPVAELQSKFPRVARLQLGERLAVVAGAKHKRLSEGQALAEVVCSLGEESFSESLGRHEQAILPLIGNEGIERLRKFNQKAQ